MTVITPIDRSQTAIRRYRCSRPIALAMAQGLIDTSRSVFDYGCGHGEDVEYLRKEGVQVAGWDPSFTPQNSIQEADVVNLGFVLNVIEDPSERRDTLKKAFSLARQLLIVSVRVDRTPARATEFNDGHVTRSLSGIGSLEARINNLRTRSLSGIGSLEARINNLRAIPGL